MRMSIPALACALAMLTLGWARPASAAWVKAETDHFIVYGNVADFIVKDYAVRLSTFDAILRAFNPPSGKTAPQKLEVYVVRSRKEFQRVRPSLSDDIAGFYTASADGMFAMAAADGDQKENDVLFHEYAHHYMLENFPAAYPGWFVEGWAEYFMTAEINRDGVTVGNYRPERTAWLLHATWLPLEQVLTRNSWQTSGGARELYYAQSWLLTHYMRSDPQRAQQMNRITADIAAGEDGVKAFQRETGLTIAELTQRLRSYNRLPLVQLKGFNKTPPAVTVSTLSAAADDMLLDRLRLVDADIDKPDSGFLADVRRKAARYPADPLAELTLARAEFTWGDVAAGEAIVERRLKDHPNDADTLAMAGFGQLLAGRRNRATYVERFRAARPLLIKAYQLDSTDYRTLYAYAFSRSIEPGFPTDNDVKALLEARALAPAVEETALLAGIALLERNDPDDARKVLGPVANNPHGGAAAMRARALMKARNASEAKAATPDAEDE